MVPASALLCWFQCFNKKMKSLKFDRIIALMFLFIFFFHRLRCLVKQLEKGDINVVDLKKNIEYAASVLEAVYIDETR